VEEEEGEGVTHINFETVTDSAKWIRPRRTAKDSGVQWNWNEINRITK